MTRPTRGTGVVIVTDSTACLSEELLEAAGGRVHVVPLTVAVDGENFVEGVDISTDEVSQAQERKAQITTSRPAPARMVELYAEIAEQGAEAIVAVHASSNLSSTVSSAHLAAAEATIPVVVIDSLTLGMAMGFAALAGARLAEAGADAGAVADVIRHVARSSRTVIYVDSLDALKRGGRVGRASALFGSALSIKPLLTVREGTIEPLERVRTRSKAMDRLVKRTVESVIELREESPTDEVFVAIHAQTRRDLADEIGARILVDLAEQPPPIVHAPLGAVVTAHVGVGTVATVVAASPIHSDGASVSEMSS